MNSGKTLQELAVEIERQAKSKRDFIAPTMSLTLDREAKRINLEGIGDFSPTDLFHRQIGDRLSIPAKYYDFCRDRAPGLLADNVNHWLSNSAKKNLVRTLDGNARAFLSERFRPLDNIDLMEAVLPVMMDSGLQIMSCEVTDKKLYIKGTTERISGEVKKGDTVQAGLVISNSEVGCGSLAVEPLIFRLVCQNGLVMPTAMRRYHVGKGLGDGGNDDGAREFFTNETIQASDRAFWLKVRDTVKGSLSQDVFTGHLNRLKEAAGEPISGNPAAVVKEVSNRFGFSDEEQGSVLNALIRDGDLSRWGLVNAITWTANDRSDYERATEFERLGGAVMELPRQDWARLSSIN